MDPGASIARSMALKSVFNGFQRRDAFLINAPCLFARLRRVIAVVCGGFVSSVWCAVIGLAAIVVPIFVLANALADRKLAAFFCAKCGWHCPETPTALGAPQASAHFSDCQLIPYGLPREREQHRLNL